MRDCYLYLTDSEKNDIIVKTHLVCQKTISNEMKRKVDTIPTTSKKNWRSSTMICDRVQLENSLYCESLCVPHPKYPERKSLLLHYLN